MSKNFRTLADLEEEELPPGRGLPGLQILGLLQPEEMDHFSARLVRFPAHSESPPTFHRKARELVYVLEGQAEFEVDGASRVCRSGDIVHVPPGAVHVIRSREHPVHFLAIESPPVTLDGDIVFVDED